MRRRIVTLLIFLLLGAIVNVAVAWGSAISVGFANTEKGLWAVSVTDMGYWNIATHSRVSGLRLTSVRSRTSQPLYSEGLSPADLVPSWLHCSKSLDEGRWIECWDVEARGWPLLMLWCKPRGWYRTASGVVHLLPKEHAIELPLPPFTGTFGVWQRMLPLRPIWPGFAINTLFYAVILWLLFAAPFALRRRRRIKRGLCPTCAYPVGASQVCTECGRPVKARGVEPAPSS